MKRFIGFRPAAPDPGLRGRFELLEFDGVMVIGARVE